MANRTLVALTLASVMSASQFVLAAEPAGAEPAQPLNERITDQRSGSDRPDRDDRDDREGLDPLGPAQPRGLAPAAPQPNEGPAECRRLPRDARQACMEGSNRNRPETRSPGATGPQLPKAAPESQPPASGARNR